MIVMRFVVAVTVALTATVKKRLVPLERLELSTSAL